MEECDICLSKIKKRNKNKHEQTKKHKYYYSNLIINKYIVRNYEMKNLKISFDHTMTNINRNLITSLSGLFVKIMMN